MYSVPSNIELRTAIEECLEVAPAGDCYEDPHGPMGEWDVSKVTDMADMFASATSFNSDISKWDVSRVTNIDGMFYNAKSFAQTLCGKWVRLESSSSSEKMFEGSSGKICATESTPSKTKSIIHLYMHACLYSAPLHIQSRYITITIIVTIITNHPNYHRHHLAISTRTH